MKNIIHLFVMLLLAVNLSAQAGGALTATIKNAINDCKNGCIDLHINGGYSPYKVSWYDSTGLLIIGSIGLEGNDGTEDLCYLAPGTYLVEVWDDLCGFVSTTFQVGKEEYTYSPVLASTNPSSCSSSDGRITVVSGLAPIKGSGQYSYQWTSNVGYSSPCPPYTIDQLKSGTYCLVATDSVSPCVYTKCVDLKAPGEPTVKIDTIINESDYDMYDGAVFISVTGGQGPFSYFWTGPNGFSAFTQDITALEHGMYTCVISNPFGCAKTIMVDVNRLCKIPYIGFRIKKPCKNNNNGSLEPWNPNACQNFTYLWSNGSSDCKLLGLSSGTYTVTITSISTDSCKGVQTFTLDPIAVPDVTANVTHICGSDGFGRIELVGDYHYQFIWNPAPNYQGKVYPYIDVSGKYCVVGFPAEPGCLIDTCFTVKRSPSMAVEVVAAYGACTPQVVVQGSGGKAPLQYQWADGTKGSTFNFPPNGQFSDSCTVTVTDSLGCQITKVFKKPAAPQINFQIYQSCKQTSGGGYQGGAIWITGVQNMKSPLDITWSDGKKGELLTNAVALKLYSVAIKDARGCTVTRANIGVGEDPDNFISAYNPEIKHTCNGGNNGFIDIDRQDGMNRLFFWSNGAKVPKNENLVSGNYKITILQDNGCAFTGAYDVKDLSGNFPAKIVGTCGGNNGNIFVDKSLMGNNKLSITWQDLPANTFDRYQLAAGTYYATITYYDCTFPSTYLVPVFTDPSNLTFQATKPCANFDNGSLTAICTTGVQPLSYTWVKRQADTLFLNSDESTISDLSAGTYAVTVTDRRGCSVSMVYPLASGILDTIVDGCVTKVRCDGNVIKKWNSGIPGFVFAERVDAVVGYMRITASNTLPDSFRVVIKKRTSETQPWVLYSEFKLNGTKAIQIQNQDYFDDFLVTITWGDCSEEFHLKLCQSQLFFCQFPKISPCTGTGNNDGKIKLGAFACGTNQEPLPDSMLTFFWVRLSDNQKFGFEQRLITDLAPGQYRLYYQRKNCNSGLQSNDFTITCDCSVDASISFIGHACPYLNSGSISLTVVNPSSHYFSWSNGTKGDGITSVSSLPAGTYGVRIVNKITGCSKFMSFKINVDAATHRRVNDCVYEFDCNGRSYQVDVGVENIQPIAESCFNEITCKVYGDQFSKDGGFTFTDYQILIDGCTAKKVCNNGYVLDQNYVVPRQRVLDRVNCGTVDVCKFGPITIDIENSFIPGTTSLKGQKDSCVYDEYCNVNGFDSFRTGKSYKGSSVWVVDLNSNDDCKFDQYCSYINEPSYYTTVSTQILNDTCVGYWGGKCYKVAFCEFTLPGELSTTNNTVKIIETIPTSDSTNCNWKYHHQYFDCTFRFTNQLLNIVDRTSLDSLLNADNAVANIFPNPFLDEIQVEFLTKVENDVEISVVDVLGREVIRSKNYRLNENQKIIYNLVDLRDGVYILKIRNAKSNIVNNFKIVKNTN